VILEADLDESPRTLRFFLDGREQPLFITHIPQSINFAVCPLFPCRLHCAAAETLPISRRTCFLPSRGCAMHSGWSGRLDGPAVGNELVDCSVTRHSRKGSDEVVPHQFSHQRSLFLSRLIFSLFSSAIPAIIGFPRRDCHSKISPKETTYAGTLKKPQERGKSGTTSRTGNDKG
jgi:hypothetical protein